MQLSLLHADIVDVSILVYYIVNVIAGRSSGPRWARGTGRVSQSEAEFGTLNRVLPQLPCRSMGALGERVTAPVTKGRARGRSGLNLARPCICRFTSCSRPHRAKSGNRGSSGGSKPSQRAIPRLPRQNIWRKDFATTAFSRTASWCKRRDRPLRASVTPWWRARARVIRPRVILRMFHTRQWPRSPCRGRRDSRTN